MILNVLLLVLGIALVIWGADKFTDGACGIARKWKVSEMVIGLTIVALGTSLPEFIVSFFSVLRGSSDMSVGNIIGSNIFNALVIVGVSAIMMRIAVDRDFLIRDIPMSLGVAMILFLMAFFDGKLGRMDALVLIVVFILYLLYTFRIAIKDKAHSDTGQTAEVAPTYKFLLIVLLGCACLVFGGHILVGNAVELARKWGVSESVIGLTILAAGTSLPELATSLVAARKGSHGLALGNAIGSNILNIAFILGVCGSIMPMSVNDIRLADWVTLIGSNVLLWVVAFTGRKLCFWEGIILFAAYILYIVYLL